MKYFIIAGEASGDLHASNLMRELKLADKDAAFRFSGGDLMCTEAGEPVIHYRDMAFMGVVNVILHAKTILRNFKIIQNELLAFQPDVVILVDYPSFNLRIARFIKKHLSSKVFYYIPPKLWAWKEYRITSIRKYVDKVFTIFPFETAFYNKHKYDVEYVGNPTVDSVYSALSETKLTFAEFFETNRLPSLPVIALLPGSRKQEIRGCLPRMIEAAKQFKDYQIVISGAPGIDADFYNKIAGGFPVVFQQTYELLKFSEAAVVNSGTATLETALVGTPEVVVYHIPGKQLGYLAKKIFVRVKFISLVNLIAGKEVIKELYAHKFSVQRVRTELELLLLNKEYRAGMLQGYENVKKSLGNSGTAKRAAEKMIKYLRK